MASIHVYKCTVAWKSPTTCNLCYLRIIGVCNIRQFIYAVFHVWILVIASAIIVLSLWIRRKKKKIDNFRSKYARNPELNFWMWHSCTFSVASILFWGHRYTWCTTVLYAMICMVTEIFCCIIEHITTSKCSIILLLRAGHMRALWNP